LHRGWVGLKAAITGKNETAVIDECERGEDIALAAYQNALKKHLPADLMSIVEEQYSEIRHSHETVRGLKRAAHAQHS
jgi:uncharacterized protein (TIGR02284 family)